MSRGGLRGHVCLDAQGRGRQGMRPRRPSTLPLRPPGTFQGVPLTARPPALSPPAGRCPGPHWLQPRRGAPAGLPSLARLLLSWTAVGTMLSPSRSRRVQAFRAERRQWPHPASHADPVWPSARVWEGTLGCHSAPGRGLQLDISRWP